MNLENILENEVSHKKTNIVCFHFYVVLIEDEFETDLDWWVLGLRVGW